MLRNSAHAIQPYKAYLNKLIHLPNNNRVTCHQSLNGFFVAHSNDVNLKLGSTPIDLSQFEAELDEYPDRECALELQNGFKYGFDIKYEGPQQLVLSKHLPSANKAPDVVRHKIAKELDAGRVAGPFKTPPFPNYWTGPKEATRRVYNDSPFVLS